MTTGHSATMTLLPKIPGRGSHWGFRRHSSTSQYAHREGFVRPSVHVRRVAHQEGRCEARDSLLPYPLAVLSEPIDNVVLPLLRAVITVRHVSRYSSLEVLLPKLLQSRIQVAHPRAVHKVCSIRVPEWLGASLTWILRTNLSTSFVPKRSC